MINPLAILQDIQMVSSTIVKVQAALPQILKIVSDIKQAHADQKSPEAFEADLATIMTDITNDLAFIASLVPPAQPKSVA